MTMTHEQIGSKPQHTEPNYELTDNDKRWARKVLEGGGDDVVAALQLIAEELQGIRSAIVAASMFAPVPHGSVAQSQQQLPLEPAPKKGERPKAKLADLPDLTHPPVKMTRSQLRQPQRDLSRHMKPWHPKEEAYVARYYLEFKGREIGEKLHRAANAVSARALAMGIVKYRKVALTQADIDDMRSNQS